jgi:predicted DCC family thiol-disulfide oxidoreductase YuxK
VADQLFSGRGLTLVYDGDCPLCSAYVTRMRLRQIAGRLDLLDARQQPALVQRLERRGYRLDEGMLVIVGDQYYHGAAAVHVLALMSSRSGWLNRLNYSLFRSSLLASVLYPLLVAGRRALLWLLGRKPLSAGH